MIRRQKKEKISLYIDEDETYHFIVGEMLQKVPMEYASSMDTVIGLIKQKAHQLDVIMFCIDNMDHAYIINELFNICGSSYQLILISKKYDASQMYELVSAYSAQDYIGKPFSKQSIYNSYQNVKKNGFSVFQMRLHNEISFFNERIRFYNNKLKLDDPMAPLSLSHFSDQVNHLMKVKSTLDFHIQMPKPPQPTILFIEDEKNIDDYYQNFINNKAFCSYFTATLKESRKIIDQHEIDIVILDLGLGGGKVLNLINELYAKDPLSFNVPDVIVTSSYYEKEAVINIINAGAKIFINKPMTYKKFISVIYQIMFLRFMRNELNFGKKAC